MSPSPPADGIKSTFSDMNSVLQLIETKNAEWEKVISDNNATICQLQQILSHFTPDNNMNTHIQNSNSGESTHEFNELIVQEMSEGNSRAFDILIDNFKEVSPSFSISSPPQCSVSK